LAFIGGGTSDRAVELARALAEQDKWNGPRPLLLITTATANTIQLDPADAGAAGPQWKPLMGFYPRPAFRFCFTNRQTRRGGGGFPRDAAGPAAGWRPTPVGGGGAAGRHRPPGRPGAARRPARRRPGRGQRPLLGRRPVLDRPVPTVPQRVPPAGPAADAV